MGGQAAGGGLPGRNLAALNATRVVHLDLSAVGTSCIARSLALSSHPVLQVGDQRCAELLADSSSLLDGLAIHRSLDLEQGVDAPDGLQGQRRDRRRRFALRRAAGVLSGHPP